jgi:hypothetical protein
MVTAVPFLMQATIFAVMLGSWRTFPHRLPSPGPDRHCRESGSIRPAGHKQWADRNASRRHRRRGRRSTRHRRPGLRIPFGRTPHSTLSSGRCYRRPGLCSDTTGRPDRVRPLGRSSQSLPPSRRSPLLSPWHSAPTLTATEMMFPLMMKGAAPRWSVRSRLPAATWRRTRTL